MDAKREVVLKHRGVPCSVVVNSLGEEINLRLTSAAKERGVAKKELVSLPMELDFGTIANSDFPVAPEVLKWHDAARELFKETVSSASPARSSGGLLMEHAI